MLSPLLRGLSVFFVKQEKKEIVVCIPKFNTYSYHACVFDKVMFNVHIARNLYWIEPQEHTKRNTNFIDVFWGQKISKRPNIPTIYSAQRKCSLPFHQSLSNRQFSFLDFFRLFSHFDMSLLSLHFPENRNPKKNCKIDRDYQLIQWKEAINFLTLNSPLVDDVPLLERVQRLPIMAIWELSVFCECIPFFMGKRSLFGMFWDFCSINLPLRVVTEFLFSSWKLKSNR